MAPRTWLSCVLSLVVVSASALGAGCASGGSPDTGPQGMRDTPRGDAPGADVPNPMDGGGEDAAVCADDDEDTFGVGPGCTGSVDCDDANADVFPDATEVCNGVNDDCDGNTDEGFGMETCGMGACATTVSTCVDGVPATCTPGTPGTETCNGLDDNCDGTTDEGFGAPVMCGVGECARTVPSCSGGTPEMCVPGTPGVETCDLRDNDCNGTVDDGLGSSSCGVGACARTTPNCVAGTPQTCSPGPIGVEVCNSQDDDCDGRTDETLGTLSCGFGRCVATAPVCVGGSPGTCTPNSGAARAETCDSVDDDCNGLVDDGIPALTCGVGACMRSVTACIAGTPQTCTPGTASTEICGDAVDQNCNGIVESVPANSTCASATAYTIGTTINADNSCSNNDHTASCGLSATGFDTTYSFASTGAQTRYTITMTGAVGYDTVLHAHSSSACTTTDEILCNDDTGGTNISQVVLDSPPAGTVFLVADTYGSGTPSTYTLTSSTTALNNDTCASPIQIRANGTYTGTTAGRVSDFTGATCQTNTTGADVVYTLVARTTGTITLDTCGSAFDTVLYVGTTCGSYATACDDDSSTCSTSFRSRLSFAATAGTTYYIVVDGYNGVSGAYTLAVSGY